MADIVRRAKRGESVDEASLQADLLDLIYATGIGGQDNEAAAAWHNHKKDAGHLDLARQFGTMADAPDPLEPLVCTPALRPELNGIIYHRWTARWRRERRGDRASLRQVRWEVLTSAEQDEIRGMARSLARFHKSMAPARRPRRDDLDTVLLLCAEIFATHTGYGRDPRGLPHSERSLFIRFAVAALKPFFYPTDVSAVSLSRRWVRLKKEHIASFPDADPH